MVDHEQAKIGPAEFGPGGGVGDFGVCTRGADPEKSEAQRAYPGVAQYAPASRRRMNQAEIYPIVSHVFPPSKILSPPLTAQSFFRPQFGSTDLPFHHAHRPISDRRCKALNQEEPALKLFCQMIPLCNQLILSSY
jgi:hypothetical protein